MLLELSSSVCAQGTRRRRLRLWGACDPGCAATREKTQSCSAMCQKRASHRHPSPPREHGVRALQACVLRTGGREYRLSVGRYIVTGILRAAAFHASMTTCSCAAGAGSPASPALMSTASDSPGTRLKLPADGNCGRTRSSTKPVAAMTAPAGQRRLARTATATPCASAESDTVTLIAASELLPQHTTADASSATRCAGARASASDACNHCRACGVLAIWEDWRAAKETRDGHAVAAPPHCRC